ncbi:MAG: hypothetical protein Q8P23_03975 [bacterium]|nr:hypothetical protein [bacterium]
MFVKSAVTLLTMLILAFGLVGCLRAAPLDPNRPLGPQKELPKEVIGQLSTLKWEGIKFYISPDVIIRERDEEKIKRLIEKYGPNEKADFRETFNPAKNSPENVATDAKLILSALPKELARRNAVAVNSPCEECLTVKVDYSEQVVDSQKVFVFGGTPVLQVRIAASIFQGDIEVLRSRGDWALQQAPPEFFANNQKLMTIFMARKLMDEIVFAFKDRFGIIAPPPLDPPKK